MTSPLQESEVGRALDAAIAERVMGFRWYAWSEKAFAERDMREVRGKRFLKHPKVVARFTDSNWPEPPFRDAVESDAPWGLAEGEDNTEVPRYSTDIAAAMLVVAKMRESGWYFACDDEGRFGKRWTAWFNRDRNGYAWLESERGDADHLAHAICLAALDAVAASSATAQEEPK